MNWPSAPSDWGLRSCAFLPRRLPHRPRAGGIRFRNYAEPRETPPPPVSPLDRRLRRRSSGETGGGALGDGPRLVAKPETTGTGPVGTVKTRNFEDWDRWLARGLVSLSAPPPQGFEPRHSPSRIAAGPRLLRHPCRSSANQPPSPCPPHPQRRKYHEPAPAGWAASPTSPPDARPPTIRGRKESPTATSHDGNAVNCPACIDSVGGATDAQLPGHPGANATGSPRGSLRCPLHTGASPTAECHRLARWIVTFVAGIMLGSEQGT